MLKTYEGTSYWRYIGSKEWNECFHRECVMIDESEAYDEKIVEYDDFDLLYDNAKRGLLSVEAGETMFLHRQYVEIKDSRDFETITRFYERNYRPIEYKYTMLEVEKSLPYILHNASSEQAIQYLKERGINSCPIIEHQ